MSPSPSSTLSRIINVWLTACLVTVGVCSCSSSEGQRLKGSTVHVHGYIRRGGTFVMPHYRTPPDGLFYNNWSTTGNVNPYTGKVGTLSFKPHNYGIVNSPKIQDLRPLTMPELNLPLPTSTSQVKYPPIKSQTVSTNSKTIGTEDAAMRIRKAEELKSLGVNVDFSQHSWLDMNDMAMRVRKANALTALGIEVNWQDHTWLEMSDWEMRIRKASELMRLGLNVNWKQHTWLDMNDKEMRIRKARDLEHLGISVNWEEHTWLEMSSMEIKARKR